MRCYSEGAFVRASATFKRKVLDPNTGEELSREVYDPEQVTVSVLHPDATQDDWVYGVDPEIKRDVVGVYYIELTLDAPGEWWYHFESHGGQAVIEHGMTVRPRKVPAAA